MAVPHREQRSADVAGPAWSAASAYTAEEALAMDGWLVRERGFTIPRLMAVAGARVAEAARVLVRERGLTRAVFLVGPGNNGGDALVAEELLRAELPTRLWRPLAADEAGMPPLDAQTLLVDGLFGVGLARPVEGAARAAVERVNASPATVLAIDVPSGLSATTGELLGAAIRAHATVTFVGPKRGFFVGAGPAHVGAWRAVDLGFPPEEAHAWLARRRAATRVP
jgi:ADP-dependent NAD(P)H-hydrate dehydratase / NAD(P)H-hydrate epimerase